MDLNVLNKKRCDLANLGNQIKWKKHLKVIWSPIKLMEDDSIIKKIVFFWTYSNDEFYPSNTSIAQKN